MQDATTLTREEKPEISNKRKTQKGTVGDPTLASYMAKIVHTSETQLWSNQLK